MRKNFFIPVFISFLLFSCAKLQEKNVKIEANKNEQGLLTNYYSINAYQVPAERRMEIMRSGKMLELNKIDFTLKREEASWQAAHKEYFSFVSKITDSNEKIIFYQKVANTMARNTDLLEDKYSDKKAETAAYYLNLLVEAGSVDVELLNAYAQVVKGAWTREKKQDLVSYVQKRLVEVEQEKKSQDLSFFRQNPQQNTQTTPKKQEVVNNMMKSMEEGRKEKNFREEKALTEINKLLD